MKTPIPMMIAVRAFADAVGKAEPDAPKNLGNGKWTRKSLKWPSEWSLIFDTETTADAYQNLKIITYQLRKRGVLVERGIAYVNDNLDVVTAKDIRVITAYAAKHGFIVRTRDDFIVSIFYKYAYAYEALVVGFNLPFDLSRLAVGISPSKAWDMRNAFSLLLCKEDNVPTRKFRHNVLVKHLNNRSAFIRFASPPRQPDGRSTRKKGIKTKQRSGFFQDVKTLAAALTGKSHSLESPAEYLETRHSKMPLDDYAGPITAKKLDYATNDTQVTWECYEALVKMYEEHGLRDTPPHRIFSEASLGKAYLHQMGIAPVLKLQPDVPPEILGLIMNSYFGGRAEAHIRRAITRVLYCDFRSMYPTVCTLMKLWDFVISQGFDWVDCTAEAQSLIDNVQLEDLQKPEFWTRFHIMLQVQADEDVVPVRAPYGGQSRTIGLNYLSTEFPLWYTLPDLIASKLLAGKPARVLKAWRFMPRAPQTALKSICIGGNPEFVIDPAKDDFFRSVIVLRGRIQALEKQAKLAGNHKEAECLNSYQMMLKLLANSTSYGIFAEENVQNYGSLRDVDCYDADGTAFRLGSKSTEEPGTHFHPLLASLITGAARLLLAVSERLASDGGMDWAFCDTDSMALARPDGMDDAEFLRRAQGVTNWFQNLDPYKDGKPLFKMEDQNFALENGKLTSVHEPLYAIAIAAKRYVLFNVDATGTTVIRKALAHGLGHLLAPYAEDECPGDIPQPVQALSEIGVDRWQYDLWFRIIRAFQVGKPNNVALDNNPRLHRPARSRYGANTAALWKWFAAFNKGKPFDKQVKCFNFMHAYQVSRAAMAESIALGELDESWLDAELPAVIAPYETNPDKAISHCFDRITGRGVPVGILKTYSEALSGYHKHAEAKFENGGEADIGVAKRRHVKAVAVEYIGKEANRWEDQFYLGEIPEAQIVYGVNPKNGKHLLGVIARAARKYTAAAVAVAGNISRQQLSAILSGKGDPRPRTLKSLLMAITRLDISRRLEALAQSAARKQLEAVAAKTSLSEVANRLRWDPSNLRKMLNGTRKLSEDILNRLSEP